MTISTVKSCQSTFSTPPNNHNLPQYKLQWRQGQLLVRLCENSKQSFLPSLASHNELVSCLKHSPVKLVQIDARLGKLAIKSLINACEQAKKPVFLRQIGQKRQGRQIKLSWYMQLINRIVAFLLLMLLSPVLFALGIIQMYVYSPSAIFAEECYVGSRGRVFQALRFRTTAVNNDTCTTSLGHLLCKYQLDKLPQLLNILRGEMSLLKPCSLSLSDVVRISIEEEKEESHLTVLPWNDLESGFAAEA